MSALQVSFQESLQPGNDLPDSNAGLDREAQDSAQFGAQAALIRFLESGEDGFDVSGGWT